MSFIDWIPVASTIKHLLQNPKGMRVSDYQCKMDNRACLGDSVTIATAILTCQKEIDRQLLENIQNYIGGVPNAIIHDAVGDIVGVVIAWLSKKYIASAAGLSIPAVGAVLVLDSFVDMGVIITTLNRMKKAAARAKTICCKCSEVPCSNSKANSKPLEIARWYWGPERSFKQTQAEAQDLADKGYTCTGGCKNGHCKPKIYVLEWSQGGFGMTRTWLKFDVYCECQ